MFHLHQRLGPLVDAWRVDGYPCDDYPAIGEILEWAHETEGGTLRFLRKPQLRALETYWYLRLVEKTPHVLDLYGRLFPPEKDVGAFIEALGVSDSAFKAANFSLERLLERIRTDDAFVKDFRLESLRETLRLEYPSYILALAMGAGKTILIGAIVATEFAMALEHPAGPFVQNALVFAPGKTIIESLRELAGIPYERILPARLHRLFAASVKLTFTRDGERDVPVIRGSAFNVVVTNTEKIRIQKEAIRKSDLGRLFSPEREDEARTEVANLRLQTVASLPHMAVFSDEAHHTYGQSLDAELKKVRKTVDYLASSTNVICVLNTTGTPYFQRQPLKDVVVWYGLSEGIRDGILKDLADSIQAYDFSGDARTYVTHVVADFFGDYGDVRLPNGAAAKLALYFPQTEDLKDLKPAVDEALVGLGYSPALCLVNTSDETLTKQADIDAFNRLNDPAAPHRVILLVNKGTEGWNCPSLFACALVRRLKRSNNFVLQAATRCLRQVPGNRMKARVYLSADNYGILDRQLQETYGETIEALKRSSQETRRTRIIVRKLPVPPLVVTQIVRTVVRKDGETAAVSLVRPREGEGSRLERTVYTIGTHVATRSVLQPIGAVETVAVATEVVDIRTAAVDLASRYRLDLWSIWDELRRLFGGGEIPLGHLDVLARQIEDQTRFYEVREERVDVSLALIKPEGFARDKDADGTEIYTAEIVYPRDRENLLLSWEAVKDKNPRDLGFHYDPYNFHSSPEKSFFEQLLEQLRIAASDVDDIYFTGALMDPAKTDFFVEYKNEKGKWSRYTPDFVIRTKPAAGAPGGSGKVVIVEVKSSQFQATLQKELAEDRPVSPEGRKAFAVRRWEGLNPDRLKYHIIFTASATVGGDQVREVLSQVEDLRS